MTAIAWRAALVVAFLAPPLAHGQSITAQPLPPPAGTAPGSPTLPPSVIRPVTPPAKPKPPAPKPAPPAPPTKPVPTVTAPAPAKKPAHKPATAKPAAPKPAVAKPPPPAKPAAPAPSPPTPTPPPAPPPDPAKGTSTGLPLPRWVALRADEVNLRTGPGMQYPIDWVYHRRDYPMRVLREYEVWRLVQDAEGTKGWVHQATLTGRRGFVVQGGEQVLRAAAADTADPVAQLMPGVVGHVRKCPAASAWCEVQAGDYRGWLKRSALYGVSPDEAIE